MPDKIPALIAAFPTMTPMQRVLTTLAQRQPDRVPFFLLLTVHGAAELGISIRDYFADPQKVATAQRLMQAKYGHDCFYAFYHAALELQAWGGEAIFFEDGPPNAGAPVIRTHRDVERITPPAVAHTSCLHNVLETIRLLKQHGDTIPIIGVVISPFSLPTMQVGFETYLQWLYDDPPLVNQLLAKNEAFCVEWANAQLAAGATAICYFDPLASPHILPKALYLQIGWPCAKRTLARIHGPTAIHLASGPGLPVIEELVATGTQMISASANENLAAVKAACQSRATIFGNLNGVEMRRWTPLEAIAQVKTALRGAAAGGGFILSDNHGEIPWQVPPDVLYALGEAVAEWGRYP